MKKILSVATATVLLATSLDARGEFFFGYDSADVKFKNNGAHVALDNAKLDRNQDGIGFGARYYTADDFIAEGMKIGVGVGFSHIETNSMISGNMAYAHFALKQELGNGWEAFGGLGWGMRGTPDTNATETDFNVLQGGMGSIGLAYMTNRDFRIELVYSYHTFAGKVLTTPEEEITTQLLGIRIGGAFEL